MEMSGWRNKLMFYSFSPTVRIHKEPNNGGSTSLREWSTPRHPAIPLSNADRHPHN